jgi:ABC-type phosphate transport system substrate-binding protein
MDISTLFIETQVHAAQQGVIIQTATTGPAAECIKTLGGLSNDQLRWMISNLPIDELDHTGWKTESVPFSDGNDGTHYWSELHNNCSATEIKITGTAAGSAAYDYLTTNVLTSANEVPRAYNEVNSFHELSYYLQANEGAIGFYQMYDILSPGYAEEVSYVQPVSIENRIGEFIAPTTTAFEEETYPLLRNIYLGVNADPASMAVTRPILEHGYSLQGDRILTNAGYWPIKGWKKLVVLTKIESKYGFPLDKISQFCSGSDKEVSIAGSTSVEPVSHLWASMLDIACPFTVDLHGGGSGVGAQRICGDLDAGNPVDIGNMSRDFLDSEAVERSLTFVHDCVQGNDKRSSVLVEVAHDALAIVVPRDGPGHRCIQTLAGLTRDQLRWIYSSYNSAELIQTGWDPASLRNTDGNPKTHRWSELDPRCEPEEIRLTGGLRGDGVRSFGERSLHCIFVLLIVLFANSPLSR